MRRVLVAGIAMLTVLGIEPAAAFNCNTARTPTEKTICAYNDLQVLDAQMESCYFAIYSDLGGSARKRFRNEQRAWLSSRNACGRNAGCITSAYYDRIDEICGGVGD